MEAESSPARQLATGALIAGRYRVEAELGRGGMAAVYRVVDELQSERLALKQLQGTAVRHQALFEREYHTLAQLSHPRIISVQEYGVDETPYYTMELLEGHDLHQVVKGGLPDVRDACLWLRDVAAALALLHSRRLIHRDVSARNVWVDNQGRAKLIDFGGLVPMGAVKGLLGTPPHISPEASYGQPLDGRSDLYSLGALAYLLLLGRHAYPARSAHQLPHHWKARPQRPAEARPELPQALSDLVMMLLSLDSRGRPGTAADVVERLTAIAQLEPDNSLQAANAYLTTPTLVGRDQELRDFRKCLLSARRGRGSSQMIVAPSGRGRSRLLSGFVLEARLAGMTVVQVSAVGSDLSGGLLALVAEALLQGTPHAAQLARELAPDLASLSDQVGRALQTEGATAPLPEARPRSLRDAFIQWLIRIGEQRGLLVAVDDVHHADEFAQAALAELAARVSDGRVVLSFSAEELSLSAGLPVLQALADRSERIDLPRLSAESLTQLMRSLFGDVPHLEITVDWLQQLCQGNPGDCMQYVQYLLDEGIVRYRAGEWILPERLHEQPLPERLDALLDARVRALSDDARRLALGLCLTHDDARPDWQPQTQLRSGDFGALMGVQQPARVFAAVTELVRLGMLSERDGGYALAQRVLNAALLRCATADELRQSHLRLSQVLLDGDYHDPQLAMLHAQRGGQDAQVLELARNLLYDRSHTDEDYWRQTRITVSANVAERLLRFVQESGHGSPADETRIRSRLLLSSTVNDWDYARYGEPQLRRLYTDCGLSHWEHTDPSLPDLERLFACFGTAQAAYDRTPEDQRGLDPLSAVREFASCVMMLGAAYANAFEVKQLPLLPDRLRPLRPLSPAIDALAHLNDYTVERAQGRERDRFEELIAKLEGAEQLSDVVRQGSIAVLTFRHAIYAARLGRCDAEAVARRFDARFAPGSWMVDYALWLGAGFRGDARTLAARERAALTTVEDDFWRRRGLLHVEIELHALGDNVLALKRLVEPVSTLAKRFPGWQPIEHLARGELHRMRGELDPAQRELECALKLAPAGTHAGYTLAAPAYAQVLLAQGDLPRLREHADAALTAAREHGLRATVTTGVAAALAVAESRAGHAVEAEGALELALHAAQASGMGGLRLAALYEAKVQVALGSGPQPVVEQALSRLRDVVAEGGMPSWLARYDKLVAAAGLRGAQAYRVHGPSQGADRTVAQLTAALTSCSEDERAMRALEALVSESSARGGHLYLVTDDRPVLMASIADHHPSEELASLVESFLQPQPEVAHTMTATSADVESAESARLEGRSYGPVFLWSDDGTSKLGLAMLEIDPEDWRRPDYAFLSALGRLLSVAPPPGDTP